MKFILLTLLLLPLTAFATDSEIEKLRQELREMKELNASYEERLRRMEASIEALATDSAGTPAQAAVAGAGEEVMPVAQTVNEKAFSTDFDPQLFDYYGYLRAGYGIGEGGESQERFQLPGAPAAYRLGNENDTYMEAGFSYYKVADRDDRQSTLFGTHFLLAFSTLDKAAGIELSLIHI
mgnify:FL=1